jgi:hypothetical protein
MTDSPAPSFAQLEARIAELEQWRRLIDEELDADGVVAEPPDLDPDDEGLDADRLIEWVHRHVTAVIARPIRGEIHWCPLWWEHPEAIFRLEALRRAWAHFAPQPGPGMANWIRDHLDPCLRELLSPLGPFADCGHHDRFHQHAEHAPLPTLPTATPP